MVTSNGPSNAEMARLNKESAIARKSRSDICRGVVFVSVKCIARRRSSSSELHWLLMTSFFSGVNPGSGLACLLGVRAPQTCFRFFKVFQVSFSVSG